MDFKFAGTNVNQNSINTVPNNVQITSPQNNLISWSAPEFTEHSKNFSWYVGLTVVAIIAAGLIYLLTRDKISTGVILIAALVLGFVAARKPRLLEYKLDSSGLTIASKYYSYDQFKSFSIIDQGDMASLYLLPLKRFMPALTVYYKPNDESKIVNILVERLPMEERKTDLVESLMHRIRF